MGIIITYFIVLAILLVLSFIFSMMDMSYGSVNTNRLEMRLRDKPKDKKLLTSIKLSKNYDKTIQAIVLINDTVNAGIDSVSTLLGIEMAVRVMGITSATGQENIGLIFSMTVLVLKIIIGEICAKSIGKIYNYKLAIGMSYVINFAYYITIPITLTVGGLANAITYPIKKSVKDTSIQDDELHEMIDEGEETGVMDEDKADMLHGAVDYASTEIFEIMTPRVKIFAVEKNTKVEELMSDPETFNHSRIPVYEENIDNIIGYIRTKSIIKLSLNSDNADEDISSIIQPIKFFPRTKEINDVLTYFHTTKQAIAVVLDEYGGTDGIITREDIIEEIVGEIWDETDDPNEPVVEKNDGTFIIDGGMNLEDFFDLFEINDDEIDTEYDTIGGFIIDLLDDKFANVNDEITFKNLEMKIMAVGKHNTVKKILVKPTINEDNEE